MIWRRYFRRKRRDAEALREIDSYLRHEVDENVARGLSLAAARGAAHRKFGNVTSVREQIHDMNTLNILDTLGRDLQYAARQFARNPVFAATAILSLALGIGANTAISR
jgi:putative ABC transport system permease protein